MMKFLILYYYTYSDMESCSIILAIHYRLHPFVEKMIHDIMTPNMIRNCFQELDIYGEHILHIVSKSKASGFARYFIRTKNHHPRSSSSHNHDRNKQRKE